jgi:TPR repeat protein
MYEHGLGIEVNKLKAFELYKEIKYYHGCARLF